MKISVITRKIINRIIEKLFIKKYQVGKVEKELKIQDLKRINPKIFQETKIQISKIKNLNKKKMRSLQAKVGGPACIELLYFLVRLLKPKVVIETGVAAGHSSTVILSAIKKNKSGILYSSDLPYFKEKNSENIIGFLVPTPLKSAWKLYCNGDLDNANHFLNEIKKADVIHYDSDKTFLGKKMFFEKIKKVICESTCILIDDVQDNNYFLNLSKQLKRRPFILKYNKKIVGILFPKNTDIENKL